jgi:predicted GNAT family N-acyltransferase
MIRIEKFRFEDKVLAEIAFSIREKVFVIEQNVDRSEEYDEFEEISTHYLAFHNEQGVATARWRYTDKGVKLERFAVLESFRGKGIGNRVLEAVLDDVKNLDRQIYLHAQLHAVPFYEKAGFKAVGEMFEEANIQHYKMVFADR